MTRLTSVEELRRTRERLQAAADPHKTAVSVCGGTACTAFMYPRVLEELKAELDRRGLTDEVPLKVVGCPGFCSVGPIVIVHPSRVFYPNVREEDVSRIIETTIQQNEIVRFFICQKCTDRAANASCRDTEMRATPRR